MQWAGRMRTMSRPMRETRDAMIKEIVKDREFLSQPAEPATPEDAQVAQDLKDTMESMGGDCACLAANQIGSRKAVIAYEDEKGCVNVMFNPRLVAFMKPYDAAEGCLSLEEASQVKRFEICTVAYEVLAGDRLIPRSKKLTGWTAEIVQHGIDHCTGKLV